MKIKLTRRAERDLKKLDRQIAARVVKVLREFEDGKKLLESLSGPLKGLFKLRVGNYRVFLEPQNSKTMIVRFIRHRSKAY